jgi:hypothetical protein
MPLNLKLTCVLCSKEIVGEYIILPSHWAASAHPSCEEAATEARKRAAIPRPVHVEFWRCGVTGRGHGWTKCSTWELCKNHGCQKAQP